MNRLRLAAWAGLASLGFLSGCSSCNPCGGGSSGGLFSRCSLFRRHDATVIGAGAPIVGDCPGGCPCPCGSGVPMGMEGPPMMGADGGFLTAPPGGMPPPLAAPGPTTLPPPMPPAPMPGMGNGNGSTAPPTPAPPSGMMSRNR